MRIAFLALTAIVTALGCSAATLPFNVKAPAWTKIAVCETEGGVNIRQRPSATAPKLVYNEAKIEDYDTPVIYYGYWATKSGGSIYPITFDDVAPIVSEQSGWLELFEIGPKKESNGWVSSKYCKVVEPTPISAAEKSASPAFMFLNTDGNVEGQYAIFLTIDEMNSDATFYIGRLVDGKIVCPYFYNCILDYQEDNSTDPTQFKRNEYGVEEFLLTRQGLVINQDEWSYSCTPNLSKFTSQMIDSVIKQAKPLETPAVIYLYNGGYYNTGSIY